MQVKQVFILTVRSPERHFRLHAFRYQINWTVCSLCNRNEHRLIFVYIRKPQGPINVLITELMSTLVYYSHIFVIYYTGINFRNVLEVCNFRKVLLRAHQNTFVFFFLNNCVYYYLISIRIRMFMCYLLCKW